MTGDPHARGPVARGGAPLSRAGLAMILLHGRGGSARDMLALAEHLALPDIACVAPEAAGNSWWPKSFLAPIAANEPGLSSGLAAVGRVAEGLERQGFGRERMVLLGFSQGACLALEYAARSFHPSRPPSRTRPATAMSLISIAESAQRVSCRPLHLGNAG